MTTNETNNTKTLNRAKIAQRDCQAPEDNPIDGVLLREWESTTGSYLEPARRYVVVFISPCAVSAVKRISFPDSTRGCFAAEIQRGIPRRKVLSQESGTTEGFAQKSRKPETGRMTEGFCFLATILVRTT